ncbi:MAG: efflux RND transporter periplasmic adaptor subunit [Planctomycetales bacterium]|nr:efflux RND transporter periplasmic adaptor subunit [Planctomycetales bacterium]
MSASIGTPTSADLPHESDPVTVPYPGTDIGSVAAERTSGVSMDPAVLAGPLKSSRAPRRKWWGYVALGLALSLFGFWFQQQGGGAPTHFAQEALLLHTVKSEPLQVTVIERGNLESQFNVPVMCEVDDYRRDGFNGTQIIWVIPNGSLVEKGDLLVELDESALREQMDEQVLETEQARELMLLAEARLDNQKSQNETNLADADLKVKLTELDVRMFTDDSNGTHRLEVESLKREIEDLNNDILSAQANLELKRNDKEGVETLFKLGYAGKSEFERSRLDFLQAESQYAAKVNRLRTQLATLNKKETYEKEMQLLELQGKLDTAKRAREQATINNAALITQLKATLDARKEQLTKEEELLDRYKQQHKACKIYAPEAGMVAYANSRYGEVGAGQYFRLRQQILSLPNLKQMQVKTAVHESVLDRVKAGQKVSIRVESFSDRRYVGTVDSVAVLPQSSGSSLGADTRFYETVIKIDGEVEQLKPGMTAVVEIQVASVEEAVTVPVQSIVSEGKRSFCYVSRDGEVERVPLELGVANDYQVEVLSGVHPGDQVVLNPISLDVQEQHDDAGSAEPANAKRDRPATKPPAAKPAAPSSSV